MRPPRGKRIYYRFSRLTNQTLDRFPPCLWWHRRQLRRLHLPRHPVPLTRGDATLAGLQIAVIGDIHAGSYGRPGDWLAMAEQVLASDPDLILLVGDLVNTRARELRDLAPALRLLTQRGPTLGVHAVPGNHDIVWGGPRREWNRALEDLGVQVLINRGLRLTHRGAPFWLAGVDDLDEGRVDLAAALQGRAAGEPAILMAHHPDTFLQSREHGVDLTVSGHTHAGQIRLGRWAPVRHSAHGWLHGGFRHGPHHLHVTAGVGATMLPIRLGTRPEVPLLELRPPGGDH